MCCWPILLQLQLHLALGSAFTAHLLMPHHGLRKRMMRAVYSGHEHSCFVVKSMHEHACLHTLTQTYG